MPVHPSLPAQPHVSASPPPATRDLLSLCTPPAAASNIFSLAQTSLLKIPGVKRVLGLPDLSKLRPAGSAAAAAVPGKPVQTYAQPPPSLSARKPRAKPGKSA